MQTPKFDSLSPFAQDALRYQLRIQAMTKDLGDLYVIDQNNECRRLNIRYRNDVREEGVVDEDREMCEKLLTLRDEGFAFMAKDRRGRIEPAFLENGHFVIYSQHVRPARPNIFKRILHAIYSKWFREEFDIYHRKLRDYEMTSAAKRELRDLREGEPMELADVRTGEGLGRGLFADLAVEEKVEKVVEEKPILISTGDEGKAVQEENSVEDMLEDLLEDERRQGEEQPDPEDVLDDLLEGDAPEETREDLERQLGGKVRLYGEKKQEPAYRMKDGKVVHTASGVVVPRRLVMDESSVLRPNANELVEQYVKEVQQGRIQPEPAMEQPEKKSPQHGAERKPGDPGLGL